MACLNACCCVQDQLKASEAAQADTDTADGARAAFPLVPCATPECSKRTARADADWCSAHYGLQTPHALQPTALRRRLRRQRLRRQVQGLRRQGLRRTRSCSKRAHAHSATFCGRGGRCARCGSCKTLSSSGSPRHATKRPLAAPWRRSTPPSQPRLGAPCGRAGRRAQASADATG